MRLGEKVEVKREISLAPYTTLLKGERGRIVEIDEDQDGVLAVNVLMDKHHRGLAEWDNRAYLVPPEADAIGPVKHTFERGVAASVAVGAVLTGLVKTQALHVVLAGVVALLTTVMQHV